jgi:predicted RNase H-like HicB family nuclease
MVAMRTYTARARRVGDWWAIDVVEFPGIFTQVRRLEQAEAMARDAIATMLDIPTAQINVEVVAPE